ncbi:MAG: DHH family phosphoesterase [Candidatus Aenigmatarchaeota archaeon]
MIDYKKVGEEISKLNKVLIVSDSDLDGISSAVQMKYILDMLKKEYKIYFRIKEEADEAKEKIYKLINRYKFDGIILLDTPMQDKYLIEIAEKNKELKIIYIDHHKKAVPDNIPANLIYFDVKALYNLSISTSNIVYKIGKALFNNEFKVHSIIASIGSIGDWTFDKDEELMKDISDYYKSLYINEKYPSISFIQYFTFFICSSPYGILKNSDKRYDPKKFRDSLEMKSLIKRM